MSVTSPASPVRAVNAGRASGSPPPVLGTRRAPRHVLVGVAVMVATALIFAVLALRADPAVPVLALARPVAAGQMITDADLQVVRVTPVTGVELLRESERSTVVGRTAAVPLVAGGLLAPAQLGAVGWPPAGESVIAVPVAAGRTPAGLVAGSRVSVLTTSTAVGGVDEPVGPVVVSASVVSVEPPTAAGVTVVSLLLPQPEARQVAAAGGEVVLVLEAPGG